MSDATSPGDATPYEGTVTPSGDATPDDPGAPLVLVVEDDAHVRELIETSLRLDGFAVAPAKDGLEGLIKIRTRRPVAIVLDLSMPVVHGLRLLDELVVEGVELPVIVVTGDVTAGDEARGRLGDANVFLKPFDVDALSARLREVLGNGEQGAQA